MAWLLSIAYTLLYVVPLYLEPSTRPSSRTRPDQPAQVRSRIILTTTITSTLVTSTFVLFRYRLGLTTSLSFRLLGFGSDLQPIFASAALTTLFYLGPLFERLVVERDYPRWRRASIHDLRNYVFAPLSEELLFRACLIPLALLTHPSQSLGGRALSVNHFLPIVLSETAFGSLVFSTPLYFAVAHVHRLIETKICWPNENMRELLLVTFIQFCYTSFFGFYTTFLFLRLGSLPACVLAHMLCNWMGLPRLWGMVGDAQFDGASSTGDSAESCVGQEAERANVKRVDSSNGLSWRTAGLTIVYYVLLIAGMTGFWHFVGRLTVSDQGLARRSEEGLLQIPKSS